MGDGQIFFRETMSSPQMYAGASTLLTYGSAYGPDLDVHVYDTVSGREVSRFAVGDWFRRGGHLEGHLTSSAGREMFVAGLDDQAIRRFDPATGSRIGDDLRPTGRVTAIRSMPVDGRTQLLVATADGRVTGYDAESGAPAPPHLTHGSTVWAVCVYRAGDAWCVATGDEDGVIRRWAATGELLGPVAGRHDAPVGRIVAGTVAGRAALVTSSGDNTVRTWDGATGAAISAWTPPELSFAMGVAGVSAVAGGLVIAYGDRVVRVDPATGATLGPPVSFPDQVYGIRLTSIAGRDVLVVSADMIHRLDAETFAPIPVG